MSYKAFQQHVNALIAKAGGDIKVRFLVDTEKGMYMAILNPRIFW